MEQTGPLSFGVRFMDFTWFLVWLQKTSGKNSTGFSFCQKFRSTPESIESYLDWGPEKLLAAIRKTKVPATMIMGSKDDRLGPDWTSHLQKTRAKVIILEGANHFMDGQFEFDLLEKVLLELKGI